MYIGWKDLGNAFDYICKTNPVVIEFMKLGSIVENIPYSQKDLVRTMYCGTYLIIHIKTGKAYVGSEYDLNRRCGKHKSDLKLNKHHNTPLLEAYNKDCNLLIMFIITNNRDKAYDIEQSILDKFWTGNNIGNLFNIEPNARSPEGVTRSIDSKIRYSLCQKGIKKSSQHRENIILALKSQMLPVIINNVSYESIKEAARVLNMSDFGIKYRCDSHNYQNHYRKFDIYSKPCIIKGKEYKSVEDYSIEIQLNPVIILSRIQNPDSLYDDYKWL